MWTPSDSACICRASCRYSCIAIGLLNSYRPLKGAMELGGLEPPTSWVRSRRSPKLSYSPEEGDSLARRRTTLPAGPGE